MTNRVVSFLRDISSGAGINAAPWSVKRHIDDVTIASGTTSGAGAAAGKSVATRAALGYPGPVYLTQTTGGQTKIDSGQVLNQVGPIWLDDIPTILQLMGIGLLAGLNVSASGLTMSVSVSAGNAMLKDGLPFTLEAAVSVGPLAASHATLERYDRIVIRHQRRGATEEGKVEFAVLQGANAAVGAGVAPALTTSATTWELSLAKVLVSPNVTTIAANKVTIEATEPTLSQYRGFVWPTVSGTPMAIAAGDIFYLDATQNFTPLHKGANGTFLTLAGGIPAWANSIAGDITSSTGNIIATAGYVQSGGSLSGKWLDTYGPASSIASSPVGTYPGAGTGAGSSIAGNDTVGEISVTTGTGTGSGDICKVIFGLVKGSTNYGVTLTPRSNNAATDLTKVKIGKLTDGFLLTAVSALNASSAYIWDYHVITWS